MEEGFRPLRGHDEVISAEKLKAQTNYCCQSGRLLLRQEPQANKEEYDPFLPILPISLYAHHWQNLMGPGGKADTWFVGFSSNIKKWYEGQRGGQNSKKG